MPTVFVSENIERIERAIEKLKANKEGLRDSIETQMNEIQEEIFRLEGCALAFKGFRDAGIEKLVPEDEKERIATISKKRNTTRTISKKRNTTRTISKKRNTTRTISKKRNTTRTISKKRNTTVPVKIGLKMDVI